MEFPGPPTPSRESVPILVNLSERLGCADVESLPALAGEVAQGQKHQLAELRTRLMYLQQTKVHFSYILNSLTIDSHFSRVFMALFAIFRSFESHFLVVAMILHEAYTSKFHMTFHVPWCPDLQYIVRIVRSLCFRIVQVTMLIRQIG